jgi:hypothetical protein
MAASSATTARTQTVASLYELRNPRRRLELRGRLRQAVRSAASD